MADASAAQSGHAKAPMKVTGIFTEMQKQYRHIQFKPSASTNASGNHNSSSVADYLNQQKPVCAKRSIPGSGCHANALRFWVR